MGRSQPGRTSAGAILVNRRFSTSGLSASRVYPVQTAAQIIGASMVTFRKFEKEGLRVIKSGRPNLVRGEDLILFLKKRNAANRASMNEGQFSCFRCNAPTDAKPGSLRFQSYPGRTGRLSAICGVCDGKVGRFCNASKVPPECAFDAVEAKDTCEA